VHGLAARVSLNTACPRLPVATPRCRRTFDHAPGLRPEHVVSLPPRHLVRLSAGLVALVNPGTRRRQLEMGCQRTELHLRDMGVAAWLVRVDGAHACISGARDATCIIRDATCIIHASSRAPPQAPGTQVPGDTRAFVAK